MGAAITRPAAAWLAILALAIVNGALREAVLLPNLSKPTAYALSGLILSACVLAVAIGLARWLRLDGVRRCATVGALWLALTLVFEFGFGIAEQKSWREILEPYTFKDGNIWPVVLAVTFLAPFAAARLRPPREHAPR